MHNLCRRQARFIGLLLNETVYRPISYFSEELKVSDKTLKEDLKVLRRFLSKYNLEILGKTGHGILLDKDAKKHLEVLNAAAILKDEVQKGSSLFRRMSILKNMLVYSNSATSVQKLSESFYVSKASIVNDIKFIEKWLKNFDLALEKSSAGTKISGEEINIRQAIASLIDEYQKNDFEKQDSAGAPGLTKLDKATLQSLLELFNIDAIIYVESVLNDMEKDENIQIADVYFVNLLTHILICIERAQKGRKIAESPKGNLIRTDTMKEYRQAEKIIALLENKYAISLGEQETYYIYQYLTSSRLYESIELEDKDEIKEIASYLINYLYEVLGLHFYDDSDLNNGLLLHIRPMLSRLRYNIRITNPLLDEIKESYPQTFGICRIIFGIMKDRFNLPEISDDEIAYIAVYCETLMMQADRKKNVVVVCHSGYGTARLLEARLKYEFPNINVAGVISSRNLNDLDLKGIDAVISTVQLERVSFPFILISALLNRKDIDSIKAVVFPEGSGQKAAVDFREIKQSLHELTITFNRKPDYRNLKKAALLPKCFVLYDTRHNEKDGNLVHLNINPGKALEFYIKCTSEQLFKKSLDYIYHLSLDNERVELLVSAKDEKTVLLLLEGVGL